LDPVGFVFEKVVSEARGDGFACTALIHKPTGYYFVFDDSANFPYCSTYSPGANMPEDDTSNDTWDEQAKDVQVWLDRVKHETAEPDLWEAIRTEQGFAAAADSEPNSNFAADERARLLAATAEVRQFSSHVGLSADQFDNLSRRLDYLDGAVVRLGKRDWLYSAAGVFYSFLLTVEQDKAIAIWQFFGQRIASAIGLLIQAAASLRLGSG
jgi:hypothetical protein